MKQYTDMAAALRNTPAEALREAGYLDHAADMLDHFASAGKPIAPSGQGVSGEVPEGMDSAPKDGTMIRLLVDYTDGGAPLEDEHPQSWTIGFNNLGNTGEDRWQFVGWSWTHDHFCEGGGTPVGWLPWSNPSTGGDVK